MATRRSPQVSDPKTGATRPRVRAPAYSDRLSQLEKDVADIKDGTVKEVLGQRRGLSDDIEEITKGLNPLIVQATPSKI